MQNKLRRKIAGHKDENYYQWQMKSVDYLEDIGIDYEFDAECYEDEVSQIVSHIRNSIDQGASISFDLFGDGKAKAKTSHKPDPLLEGYWWEPKKPQLKKPKFEDLYLEQRIAQREKERLAAATKAFAELEAERAKQLNRHRYTFEQDTLMIELHLQDVERRRGIVIDREGGKLVKDLARSCRSTIARTRPIKRASVMNRLNLVEKSE